MKPFINTLITLLITFSLPLNGYSHIPANSNTDELEVISTYRYLPAKSNKLFQSSSTEVITSTNGLLMSSNSNAGIVEKSILLIKLADAMKESMDKFHKLKCDADDILPPPGPCPVCIKAPCPKTPGCMPPIKPMKKNISSIASEIDARATRMPPRCAVKHKYDPSIRGCVPYPRPCNLNSKKQELSKNTLKRIEALEKEIDALPSAYQDEKLVEIVDLAKKLAMNIKTASKNSPIAYEADMGRPAPMGRAGGVSSAPSPMKKQMSSAGGTSASRGLSVTAGGAQDMDFIRTLIKRGDVPHADNLVIEGMLSEHDLSFPSPKACKELLCMETATVAKSQTLANGHGKLFVQVEMNSNVTADNFERDDLNLSIVLDISGSMGADDGTAHSRMEWGKKAIKKTLDKLDDGDMVSIVLFNGSATVLSKPVVATDANKKMLLASVDQIQAGGSTNLESGLSKGFEFASQLMTHHKLVLSGRVLLISDAGLNTGVTDDKVILKMVSDYAAEGVGLTAMGLGLNFKQDFIHGITQSRGGNYIFVQNGEKLFKFFKDQFDFLVTPVAYDFKVQLKLAGAPNAKLVKAYGVPMDKKSPVKTLIDIRSLFFSGEGSGGAIVLEYDL